MLLKPSQEWNWFMWNELQCEYVLHYIGVKKQGTSDYMVITPSRACEGWLGNRAKLGNIAVCLWKGPKRQLDSDFSSFFLLNYNFSSQFNVFGIFLRIFPPHNFAWIRVRKYIQREMFGTQKWFSNDMTDELSLCYWFFISYRKKSNMTSALKFPIDPRLCKKNHNLPPRHHKMDCVSIRVTASRLWIGE